MLRWKIEPDEAGEMPTEEALPTPGVGKVNVTVDQVTRPGAWLAAK